MIRPILSGCCANAGTASASAARAAAICLFMVSLLGATIASRKEGGNIGLPPTRALLLPAELAAQPRLGDGVAVDHVPGERGARAAHVEAVDLERVQGEVVAMRPVADRGAGAPPSRARRNRCS